MMGRVHTERKQRSYARAADGPRPTTIEPGFMRTATGSAQMTSLPPAQPPSSAAGCASSRTRRSASADVISQSRG